jgi:hypothetical protein
VDFKVGDRVRVFDGTTDGVVLRVFGNEPKYEVDAGAPCTYHVDSGDVESADDLNELLLEALDLTIRTAQAYEKWLMAKRTDEAG